MDVCEARDIKGLYKKARSGEIRGFTGIDSDYEAPEKADLILNTVGMTELECVQELLSFLVEKGILPKELYEEQHEPVKELFVQSEQEKATLLQETESAPEVELSLVDLQWLQVLAEGWATPLNGFMRERQYLQALHFNQLIDLEQDCASLNGTTSSAEPHSEFGVMSQSVPIVLPINDEQKEKCQNQKQIRLVHEGKVIAILSEPEIFKHNKEERVHRQFACTDTRHPTVELIMSSGDWCLGGDLKVKKLRIC